MHKLKQRLKAPGSPASAASTTSTTATTQNRIQHSEQHKEDQLKKKKCKDLTEDVGEWLTNMGLSRNTLKLLEKENFTTKESILLLSRSDIDKFHIPLADKLRLWKAITDGLIYGLNGKDTGTDLGAGKLIANCTGHPSKALGKDIPDRIPSMVAGLEEPAKQVGPPKQTTNEQLSPAHIAIEVPCTNDTGSCNKLPVANAIPVLADRIHVTKGANSCHASANGETSGNNHLELDNIDNLRLNGASTAALQSVSPDSETNSTGTLDSATTSGSPPTNDSPLNHNSKNKTSAFNYFHMLKDKMKKNNKLPKIDEYTLTELRKDIRIDLKEPLSPVSQRVINDMKRDKRVRSQHHKHNNIGVSGNLSPNKSYKTAGVEQPLLEDDDDHKHLPGKSKPVTRVLIHETMDDKGEYGEDTDSVDDAEKRRIPISTSEPVLNKSKKKKFYRKRKPPDLQLKLRKVYEHDTSQQQQAERRQHSSEKPSTSDGRGDDHSQPSCSGIQQLQLQHSLLGVKHSASADSSILSNVVIDNPGATVATGSEENHSHPPPPHSHHHHHPHPHNQQQNTSATATTTASTNAAAAPVVTQQRQLSQIEPRGHYIPRRHGYLCILDFAMGSDGNGSRFSLMQSRSELESRRVQQRPSRLVTLETMTIPEYYSSSARILQHMIQTDNVSMDTVTDYLLYMDYISELFATYKTSKVLEFDDRYRALQAVNNFRWGTQTPSLETEMFAEHRPTGYRRVLGIIRESFINCFYFVL